MESRAMTWQSADHVLVTGGAGFIGRHLTRALRRRGKRVTVLDDLSCASAREPQDPTIRFVRGSVLDAEAIDVAARDVQAIVHLAGIVGMRLATTLREKAYRISDEGTRLLLERTGERPVVLASSSAVYGLHEGGPVSEGATIGSEDALDYDGGKMGYAFGKLVLEAHGRAAKSHRPAINIRPFNVVGTGQVSNYGMVIPTFIERARRGEPLVVYDDGLQTRSFSEVKTFVNALLDALDTSAAWAFEDGALNIGTQTATTISHLAAKVIARLCPDAEAASPVVIYKPYQQAFPGKRDVRSRVPDTSRLCSLIGEVAWPSLDDILDRLIASSAVVRTPSWPTRHPHSQPHPRPPAGSPAVWPAERSPQAKPSEAHRSLPSLG